MAMDMTTALTIKANVVGQGQISGLQKGLGRVTGETRKATTAMGRLRGAAAGALGAMRSFLPVLGVAGIAAFAKNNLDAADSLSKLSQRTGIAVPALDRFRQAANLSDTSIQSLQRAFPALTKNIDDAAQKAKGPAFDAFQRLGVAVRDANGNVRDADAVMLDIADRFQGMADGTEKAALASAVFGTRIGSELIPMLNLGGQQISSFSTVMTQEFADKAAVFNDKITDMGERFQKTGTNLLIGLLPYMERLLDVVDGSLLLFSKLPGPLQAVVVSVTALGAAMLILSPLASAVTAAFGALAGLKIGATIAGYLPVIAKLVGSLGGLLKIIAAVFTGPAGWVALLAAAGVAIYNFRDEIGGALEGIYDFFQDIWTGIGEIVSDFAESSFDFIKQTFIDPVIDIAEGLGDKFESIFRSIGDFIKDPFVAAFTVVRGVVNNMLSGITTAINSVVAAINKVISGANNALRRLKLPTIPLLSKVSVPQFAEGGVVNGPTLAMVGEGGEPEYIIPASKMGRASANYLGGMRGKSVIPAFAEGGVVGPGAGSGGMGGGAANTTVNVTTGPVLQQDGQNYVTVGDLERALKSFGNQMLRNSRSVGGRRYQGVYS